MAQTTRWFYGKDAATGNITLKHAHPLSEIGTRAEWHTANTVHWDAPDLHITYNSYNTRYQEWSSGSVALTSQRKDSLIETAKREHIAAKAMGQGSSLPTTNEVALPNPPVSTQAITISDELEARLTNIETANITTLQMSHTAMTDAGKAAIAAAQAKERAEATVQVVNVKLGTVHTRMDTIEKLARTMSITRHEMYAPNATEPTNVLDGPQHKQFTLMSMLARKAAPTRKNIWIHGPAGAGKTTAVKNFAQLMGLEYRYIPAVLSQFTLLGFISPTTQIYQPSHFRHIYEFGGVVLLDECDASSAEALVAINGAVDNGVASFPDKMVDRHPDCYIFATANTTGFGATAQYSARQKQDAAFLDRFLYIDFPYDEEFEYALSAPHAREWLKVVQECRHTASNMPGGVKADIVISPRSAIFGGDLLAEPNPATRRQVVDATLGKFSSLALYPTIFKAAEDWVAQEQETTPQPTSNSNSSNGSLRFSNNFRNVR